MKILVTGNAGFIGFHVSRLLLERGDEVVGFDIVNDYYDVRLKQARLAELQSVCQKSGAAYSFIQADLADRDAVKHCFSVHRFDRVIHLAAQAGVRYSIENPHAYVQSNLVGFTNIIEACRHAQTPHLTYASTSSVYGANGKMPFSERDGADHPLQFYAATKRANELMAHSYSHLYGLPTTGLRFFTVYGPWGRPDMAPMLFARNILEGRPIQLFSGGNHARDFTYIDDISEGVVRASDDPAGPDANWDALAPNPATSRAPYRIFNIGNENPVSLLEFVAALEEALGRKAEIELVGPQPGDVPETFANVDLLRQAVGFEPSIPIRVGVAAFAAWYRSYHETCLALRP